MTITKQTDGTVEFSRRNSAPSSENLSSGHLSPTDPDIERQPQASNYVNYPAEQEAQTLRPLRLSKHAIAMLIANARTGL